MFNIHVYGTLIIQFFFLKSFVCQVIFKISLMESIMIQNHNCKYTFVQDNNKVTTKNCLYQYNEPVLIKLQEHMIFAYLKFTLEISLVSCLNKETLYQPHCNTSFDRNKPCYKWKSVIMRKHTCTIKI